LRAAREGLLDEVQELIQQGTNVNTVNRRGQSALFFACESGHYHVTKYLLENGALVNYKAKPLIAAARREHGNCVDLLLEHGADVSVTNMMGETAMDVALDNMDVCIILSLLDHGAKPYIPLESLLTKLFICADAVHAKMFHRMLNNGVLSITSDKCLVVAFLFAFKHRSLELASDLLSWHFSLNMELVYPLAMYYSVRNNWYDILTELLKKGVDVNLMTASRTPLYAACQQLAEDVVILLLQNGADPNLLCQTSLSTEKRKETALHVACTTDESKDLSFGQVQQNEGRANSGKCTSIVKLLLKHGANINGVCDKGETALYRACESKKVEVVQLLLDAGADVSITTPHAYPLYAACTVNDARKAHNMSEEYQSDAAAIIELLLKNRVDVNLKCPKGGTALHKAIRSGLTDAVRLLLENGADVGDCNESSTQHPLYIACNEGSALILDLLLQHSTKSNFSPPVTNLLGVAVEKGFAGVTKVLCEHGADVNKAVLCGKTVFVYVLEQMAFSRLKLSITDKDLQLLRLLVEAGADVNVTTFDGQSALHIACSGGSCEMLQLLLQHGANCNKTKSDGKTALHVAYEKQNLAAVELLLKSGADPNIEAFFGYSEPFSRMPLQLIMPLLFLAASKGDNASVGILSQYGAEVNWRDKEGNTALHVAKTSAVVKTLTDAGADVNVVNRNNETPLYAICASGKQCDANSVELLLKAGADANCCRKGKAPLHAACKYNKNEAVKLLLAYGADANVVSRTSIYSDLHRTTGRSAVAVQLFPLSIACKNRNTAMVIELLKKGASTEFADVNGETALHVRIKNVKTASSAPSSIVRILIEHGASVNAATVRGETPLYLACEKGLSGVVRQLIESNADVNASHCEYRNPLLVACERNVREIVSMLLNNGANVNVICGNKSPLTVAAAKADTGLIEELLNRGADINLMENDRNTALHEAVVSMRYGEHSSDDLISKITTLLNHGANVDALNGVGETALQLACSSRPTSETKLKYTVIELLLKSGADSNSILSSTSHSDSRGTSILSYAARHNDVTLMTLLLKFDASLELKDTAGKTALYYALEPDTNIFKIRYSQNNSYSTAALELLLKSGAQVNITDENGMSPLSMACKKGALVFVKTLLSWGANPNLTTKANCPLLTACKRGYHEIAKLLLEREADVQATDEEDNKCVLLHAFEALSASNPNLSIVNLLLDYGADTNIMTSSGETLFYLACSKGLTSIVQRMLKCGAKVNASKDERSPLNAACKNENPGTVELLLSEGADPNVPEEIGNKCAFALHIAAAGNSDELVNLLLKHGANVNIMDTSGDTALHHAIYRGPYMSRNYTYSFPVCTTMHMNRQKVVDALLCAGADVNVSNSSGATSLFLAVKKGLLDIVSSMLLHGGNPSVPARDKYFLCLACNTQNVKLVEMLLKAGADPNLTTVDTDGSSSSNSDSNSEDTRCELPLCTAVKEANHELTELLLNGGAKVNVLNLEGKSVLHLALENLNVWHGNRLVWEAQYVTPKMVKLLLERGADANQLMPDNRSLLSLLIRYAKSDVSWSDRHCVISTELVHETVRTMISKGASLADSSNNLGDDFMPGEVLKSLCAWCCLDDVAIDLLKAGAGFQLLAFYCRPITSADRPTGLRRKKSVRVCQAAIMAGYVPSTEELVEMQQSVSGEDLIPEHVQLLSWLNEDRQQAPSLMRQCRVAVRQQLSVASSHSTIIPAIDQLPLPCRLQKYLKFEGSLTEIHLSEATNMEEASNVLDDDFDYDIFLEYDIDDILSAMGY